MDRHFATADFTQNMPVLLGATRCFGTVRFTLMPIRCYLMMMVGYLFFPNYLTQRDGGNGKSVNRQGKGSGLQYLSDFMG